MAIIAVHSLVGSVTKTRDKAAALTFMMKALKRNVEDLLFERGNDLCHETVRLWWNRFGPLLAGEIRFGSFPLAHGHFKTRG